MKWLMKPFCRNGTWKNASDYIPSFIPSIIQGYLGPTSYCGSDISDNKLGNRSEEVLSSFESSLLLWHGKKTERVEDWMDTGMSKSNLLLNFGMESNKSV